MLNSLPVSIVLGTLLGFLSGLGIGGGSLFVLWLTLVINHPADIARSINLMFFLPCAVFSCLIRWKSVKLKWNQLLPSAVFGCLSAILFSWISQTVGVQIIRKIFGILLICTGLRELLYKKKQ